MTAGATGAAPPTSLTTDRLLLRPPQAGDAEAIHRLVNDWGVVRMLRQLPFPYPRPLAEEWTRATAGQAASRQAYHFVIAMKSDPGTVLGCVGLELDATGADADLGYWVARASWGGGIASEAAARVARWALDMLGVERLTAQVAIDNPASAAVLRRIGFRETGASRQFFVARGSAQPVLLFEVRRTDLQPPPEAAPARGLLLVAACALIDTDGRILLARRPQGRAMAGLWEFPGGKMEPGETPEQALIRELHEELAIGVGHACLAPFTFASHAYAGFHLLMPLYLCRRWTGIPRAKEGQTLAWVRPERLADYPMPEADKPLVPMLRDYL